MTRTFVRYGQMQSDLVVPEYVDPVVRAYFATRMTDDDVDCATFENFKPAVPVRFSGIVFATAGYSTV